MSNSSPLNLSHHPVSRFLLSSLLWHLVLSSRGKSSKDRNDDKDVIPVSYHTAAGTRVSSIHAHNDSTWNEFPSRNTLNGRNSHLATRSRASEWPCKIPHMWSRAISAPESMLHQKVILKKILCRRSFLWEPTQNLASEAHYRCGPPWPDVESRAPGEATARSAVIALCSAPCLETCCETW